MNPNDSISYKENSSEFKKTFAENLKRARLKAGLSQKKLAELMNVPAPTISRYENGLMEPTLRTAKALALILRCDLNELANYDYELDKEEKAFLWNSLLQPNISVSYNHETDSYELTVERSYTGFFLKPGGEFIIHSKVFDSYQKLLKDYMVEKMTNYQRELFLQYIETILLHASEIAKTSR